MIARECGFGSRRAPPFPFRVRGRPKQAILPGLRTAMQPETPRPGGAFRAR